jgi:hypothetical protein
MTKQSPIRGELAVVLPRAPLASDGSFKFGDFLFHGLLYSPWRWKAAAGHSSHVH